MLAELDPTEFPRTRGLFSSLDFRLDCVAALDGQEPGRIWVDDPADPRAAFLAVSWSYFLAGEPNEEFCRDLNRLITEEIYRADPLGGPRISVRIVADARVWDEAMEDVLAGREVIRARRRSYLYDLADDPPICPVPDGCLLRPLSKEILSDPSIEVHRLVTVPMETSHGSAERFLEECFMAVAILDGRTVSWAIANHLVGTRCEMGIGTDPDHRRRGLGVATTAAGLALAKKRCFATVSWQCGERNPASWRIAEKLGFALEREYTGYMAVGDEKIHADVLARWRNGELVY